VIVVENVWSLFSAVANSSKVLSVAGAESTRLAILVATSDLVYVSNSSAFNTKLLSTFDKLVLTSFLYAQVIYLP
jgi:hypothetical protein